MIVNPGGGVHLKLLTTPIALVSSMLVFDERLAANEWSGIALIGAGLAILAGIAWRQSRRDASVVTAPAPLDGG